jgi:hypothetical protein
MASRPGDVHSDKKTITASTEEFVQRTADKLMAGNFTGLKSSTAGPPTEHDRRTFMRICGLTPEDFNARLSTRMGELADRVVGEISERLPDFKTSELAYVLSVLEDKRGTLNGRVSLTGSQVNVQINNFGDKSKEQIIESLFPSKSGAVLEAEPINESESADVI